MLRHIPVLPHCFNDCGAPLRFVCYHSRQGLCLPLIHAVLLRRLSAFVKVRWNVAETAADVVHICVIKRFYLLHPLCEGQHPLRVAHVRVYDPLPPKGGMLAANAGKVDSEDYIVDISQIDAKVVAAFPDGFLLGNMLFMAYSAQSRQSYLMDGRVMSV